MWPLHHGARDGRGRRERRRGRRRRDRERLARRQRILRRGREGRQLVGRGRDREQQRKQRKQQWHRRRRDHDGYGRQGRRRERRPGGDGHPGRGDALPGHHDELRLARAVRGLHQFAPGFRLRQRRLRVQRPPAGLPCEQRVQLGSRVFDLVPGRPLLQRRLLRRHDLRRRQRQRRVRKRRQRLPAVLRNSEPGTCAGGTCNSDCGGGADGTVRHGVLLHQPHVRREHPIRRPAESVRVDLPLDCSTSPNGPKCSALGTCGCTGQSDCASAPGGSICGPAGVCGCVGANDCPPQHACGPSFQCTTACAVPGQLCNSGCCSGTTGTCLASCGGGGTSGCKNGSCQ